MPLHSSGGVSFCAYDPVDVRIYVLAEVRGQAQIQQWKMSRLECLLEDTCCLEDRQVDRQSESVLLRCHYVEMYCE